MKRPGEMVVGSGEPLVLVHGLAGSWRWWSPVLERLARTRRVHAINLPRLRRATPATELFEWLERRLEAAQLDRVDLAGHSLGGLVAAELAALRPERVGRLVLVAPAGIPCGRSVPGRSLPLVETLYDLRRSLRLVVSDSLRAGPFGLARGIAYVSVRDLRAELPQVRAPTLLVWGERDRLVPLWVAEEWQRLVPHARLELLPCGHVPMLEQPGAVADRIAGFLEQELPDDPGHGGRSGEMDGMRLAGNDDEPTVG
jgi:pimeloyl-ACP methyl ester carboxylesterase